MAPSNFLSSASAGDAAGAPYPDEITRTTGEAEALEQQITASRLRIIPGANPIAAVAVEPGCSDDGAGFPHPARTCPASIRRWRETAPREGLETGAAGHSPICDIDYALKGLQARPVVGTKARRQIADGASDRPGQYIVRIFRAIWKGRLQRTADTSHQGPTSGA